MHELLHDRRRTAPETVDTLVIITDYKQALAA